jgi:hypothetical protein
MTVLAAAAASLGAAVRVRASEHHPVMGLQLYCFGVGDSGSGKSKTLNSLLSPFSHSETVLTDATSEALQSSLARHPRGVLLELSEGRDFNRMLGRYNQAPGSSSDNSLFHKCWSGDRIRVARQKGSFTIDHPHVVVAAAIQKLNLNQIPAGDVVDGLMQRVLKKPNNESLRQLREFEQVWPNAVTRLTGVKPFYGTTTAALSNSPSDNGPLVLTLDEEAYRSWSEYAAWKRSDDVEKEWPEEHPFRSDVLRHAEYVVRLAACLMMLDLVGDGLVFDNLKINSCNHGWIGVQYVRSAIKLMEWVWWHKQRLMDGMVEVCFAKASSPEMSGTRTIAESVTDQVQRRKLRVERRCGVEWSLRDYYRVLGLKRLQGEAEVADLLKTGRVRTIRPGTDRVQKYSFVEENSYGGSAETDHVERG